MEGACLSSFQAFYLWISLLFFRKSLYFYCKSNRNNRPFIIDLILIARRNCLVLRNARDFVVASFNLHIALEAKYMDINCTFLSPQHFQQAFQLHKEKRAGVL
jgi:hypothetical protein